MGLFAVYRAPPLVQGVCAAAGAVVALLAAWLLQQASGRPVLQALSACSMLVATVAASFAWPCSAWRAAAAAVPLACAGKRLTGAACVMWRCPKTAVWRATKGMHLHAHQSACFCGALQVGPAGARAELCG